MTAKFLLHARREPAEAIPFALLYRKSGFGEIVLRRDRLHRLIGQPPVRDKNRRGIAVKRLICKCVDDVLLHMPSQILYSGFFDGMPALRG